MSNSYSLEKSRLYRLRNKRKLSDLLGLEKSYFRKKHKYVYRYSEERKRDGGIRYIADPEERLKVIQRRIHILLQRIDTPEWLKSGKRGESYISNGEYHLGADYLRTMDISHFYDSVRRDRVYHLFLNGFKMADDIATIMTNLVMDGYTLPTGAPSSQMVAFWAYRDMFEEVYRIAVRYNCKFSLYVDDMTFSSKGPIPSELRNEVADTLHKYGLHAKRSKDHYYRKQDFKVVTGYGFIGGQPKAQNRVKRDVITMYKQVKSDDSEKGRRSLQGKLNAARRNQPGLYTTMQL